MLKIIFFLLVAITALSLLYGLFLVAQRFRKPALKQDKFMEKWLQLQKNCAQRKTWPQAIIDADDLLDEALKKNKFKGRTTGERLVSAQKVLSSNETVWFGHKLRNKIINEDVRKLRKDDILQALGGFRQALRDLGALKYDK